MDEEEYNPVSTSKTNHKTISGKRERTACIFFSTMYLVSTTVPDIGSTQEIPTESMN